MLKCSLFRKTWILNTFSIENLFITVLHNRYLSCSESKLITCFNKKYYIMIHLITNKGDILKQGGIVFKAWKITRLHQDRLQLPFTWQCGPHKVSPSPRQREEELSLYPLSSATALWMSGLLLFSFLPSLFSSPPSHLCRFSLVFNRFKRRT